MDLVADLAARERNHGGHQQIGRDAEQRLRSVRSNQDRRLIGAVGHIVRERERAQYGVVRAEDLYDTAGHDGLAALGCLQHDVLRARLRGRSRKDLDDLIQLVLGVGMRRNRRDDDGGKYQEMRSSDELSGHGEILPRDCGTPLT